MPRCQHVKTKPIGRTGAKKCVRCCRVLCPPEVLEQALKGGKVKSQPKPFKRSLFGPSGQMLGKL